MVLGSSAGVGAGVDLKDSEEVAEYIDNLGIEYRFVFSCMRGVVCLYATTIITSKINRSILQVWLLS